MERLDRFLVPPEWVEEWPSLSVKHLLKVEASDHRPILLSLMGLAAPRKSQFRFEEIWLQHSESWDIIRQAWARGIQVARRSNPFYRLNKCLFFSRKALSSWSRSHVTYLFEGAKVLEHTISSLQDKEMTGSLDNTEISQLASATSLYNGLLAQQETYWRQRSRLALMAEGDRNTRYFHTYASIRKRKNMIQKISSADGSENEGQKNISAAFFEHFRGLWGNDLSNGDVPSDLPGPSLSEEHRVVLLSPISPEEIWKAICSLPCHKAPGVDGFAASFYRAYWEIIKSEVISAIQAFFASGDMPSGWKKTLIHLIPKSVPALSVKDYRPISLCTFPYKICAKIMANRLKPIIPSIVGREQGALVAARSISDNILVATEVYHTITVARPPRSSPDTMILKLDMEKAFDKVSWKFLEQVLNFFGFPPTWRCWVLGMISNPSFSILTNGECSAWFHSSKGICQGCSLSPFLFVLCAEIFSRILHKEQNNGNLEGIQLALSLPKLSHLLFADDVVLFGEASIPNCHKFKEILRCYCSISGQMVNTSKSRIAFSQRISPPKCQLIRDIFEITSSEDVGIYLGIPFSAHAIKDHHLLATKEKILKKLALWKTKSLSVAGRLCLINHSLMPILFHAFSHCSIPAAVLKWVDLQVHCFVWNHPLDIRKWHYVNWSDFCTPKRQGGAGILDISKWYRACIQRRAFQVISEPNTWWVSVVRAKYGFSSWLDPGKKCYTSSFWRSLKREGPSVSAASSMMIVNGRDVNIWHDLWIPGTILLRSGLEFNISCYGFVSSLLPLLEEQNWAFDRISALLGQGISHLIHSSNISFSSRLPKDSIVWGGKKTLQPKIMDFYISLHRSNPMTSSIDKIWEIKCPEMAKIMLWKAFLGKLPTRAFVMQFGLSDGTCIKCQNVQEDIHHIFFGCPFAATVWDFIYSSFKQMMKIQSMDQLRTFLLANAKKADWHLVSTVSALTMWHIWCARNKLLFEGKHSSPRSVSLSTLASVEVNFYLIRSRPKAKMGMVMSFVNSGWKPPHPGGIKLNYSGTWHPFIGSGIGFTIRGSNGQFFLAGSHKAVVASHLHADLLAASWALDELHKRIGNDPLLSSGDIWLEGSSPTIAEWLAGHARSLHPALISARLLMGKLSNLKISVCSHAAGLTSWRLAEYGRRAQFPLLWHHDCTPPSGLAKSLGLGGFVPFP